MPLLQNMFVLDWKYLKCYAKFGIAFTNCKHPYSCGTVVIEIYNHDISTNGPMLLWYLSNNGNNNNNNTECMLLLDISWFLKSNKFYLIKSLKEIQ